MSTTTRRTIATSLLTAAALAGTAGCALALPPVGPGGGGSTPPPPPNHAPHAVITAPDAVLVSRDLRSTTVQARAAALPNLLGRNVATFSAAGSSDDDGTIVKYQWDLDGNGSFETTTTAPKATASFTQVGSLPIAVRAVDDDGATSNVAQKTIIIHEPPTARLSLSAPVALIGQSVTADGTASTDDNGPPSVDYDLDGDGTYETSGAGHPLGVAFSFQSVGTRTIRVRATDRYGATSTASQTVVVHRAPTAAFTAGPNPAAVGETVTFDGSGSTDDAAIADYAWDLDGNGSYETDTGRSARATRRYAGPGTVTAKLRVTDSHGVQDVVAHPISVVPAAQVAGASSDHTAPAVTLSSGRKRLSTTGRVALGLRCPAGERLCRGTLTVRSTSGRTLGARRFVLGGGDRTTLRVLLSRTARSAVRHAGSMSARVTASVTDASGNRGTSRAAITIKKHR